MQQDQWQPRLPPRQKIAQNRSRASEGRTTDLSIRDEVPVNAHDLPSLVACPTGFEPVTFGSTDAVARDLALASQNQAPGSPKSRQKFRIAPTIHRVEQLTGRAAGDAYSYGERAYDPPHVRHPLLV
jgi:hypothetical protein